MGRNKIQSNLLFDLFLCGRAEVSSSDSEISNTTIISSKGSQTELPSPSAELKSPNSDKTVTRSKLDIESLYFSKNDHEDKNSIKPQREGTNLKKTEALIAKPLVECSTIKPTAFSSLYFSKLDHEDKNSMKLEGSNPKAPIAKSQAECSTTKPTVVSSMMKPTELPRLENEGKISKTPKLEGSHLKTPGGSKPLAECFTIQPTALQGMYFSKLDHESKSSKIPKQEGSNLKKSEGLIAESSTIKPTVLEGTYFSKLDGKGSISKKPKLEGSKLKRLGGVISKRKDERSQNVEHAELSRNLIFDTFF